MLSFPSFVSSRRLGFGLGSVAIYLRIIHDSSKRGGCGRSLSRGLLGLPVLFGFWVVVLGICCGSVFNPPLISVIYGNGGSDPSPMGAMVEWVGGVYNWWRYWPDSGVSDPSPYADVVRVDHVAGCGIWILDRVGGCSGSDIYNVGDGDGDGDGDGSVGGGAVMVEVPGVVRWIGVRGFEIGSGVDWIGIIDIIRSISKLSWGNPWDVFRCGVRAGSLRLPAGGGCNGGGRSGARVRVSGVPLAFGPGSFWALVARIPLWSRLGLCRSSWANQADVQVAGVSSSVDFPSEEPSGGSPSGGAAS